MHNRINIGGSKLLTDADLYGGVSYEISVNEGSDYTIGTTASAKIQFTTSAVSTSFLGVPLTYQKQSRYSPSITHVGKFIITDIKKSTGGKYKVTAYDYVSKFDIIVDNYINNSTYPMTLKTFFRGLCAYCGVSYSNDYFVNENMTINKNFDGNNTTGRQVLGYIAQAAGAFARANSDGEITLAGYKTTSSISLDNTKYVSALIADYTAPVISKLWIGMANEDVGIVSGTGDVLMRITYNPLFFGDTTQEHQADADNVYAKIHSVSYRPVQINLLEDYGIEAGDRITINGYETIVMKKRMDSTGVVLESDGNATREIAVNNDSEIVALRGKYNKLSRTVEETVNTVGDLSTDMETTVRLRADGFTIEDKDHEKVVITGTCVDARTLNAQDINTTDLNMSGRIAWGDLSSSCQQEINSKEDKSIHRQNTIPTNPAIGDLWYVTADVTSGGVTYYEDTWYTWTGTEWKLSDNPYYIKSTYIDSTIVKSPTIEGNQVVVNSDYGGSFWVKKAGVGKGYMGVGSAWDANGSLVEGIVVANGKDTYLDEGDYYFISTSQSARMQAGNFGIYVNNTGAFMEDSSTGDIIPLGYARFG